MARPSNWGMDQYFLDAENVEFPTIFRRAKILADFRTFYNENRIFPPVFKGNSFGRILGNLWMFRRDKILADFRTFYHEY